LRGDKSYVIAKNTTGNVATEVIERRPPARLA